MTCFGWLGDARPDLDGVLEAPCSVPGALAVRRGEALRQISIAEEVVPFSRLNSIRIPHGVLVAGDYPKVRLPTLTPSRPTRP